MAAAKKRTPTKKVSTRKQAAPVSFTFCVKFKNEPRLRRYVRLTHVPLKRIDALADTSCDPGAAFNDIIGALFNNEKEEIDEIVQHTRKLSPTQEKKLVIFPFDCLETHPSRARRSIAEQSVVKKNKLSLEAEGDEEDHDESEEDEEGESQEDDNEEEKGEKTTVDTVTVAEVELKESVEDMNKVVPIEVA